MFIRKMASAVALAICAVGLVSMLAGCGGNSEKKPPVDTRLQQLIDQATVKVHRVKPQAVLLEVQGFPQEDTTGRSFNDVKSWKFVFHSDPLADEPGSVTIDCVDGVFSDPTILNYTITGDTYINEFEPMGFDEAVARAFEAGYDTHFTSVAYRQPLDLINDEVSYIFHIPSARSYIFVGTRTGKVKRVDDHANAANDMIMNTSEYCRNTFPSAEFLKAKGDVVWSGGSPGVAEWVIQFTNPAKTPATTLVMNYVRGGEMQDPTEEQRTITGLKKMEPNLLVDPGDAIQKLNDAGYTEEFTSIGFEYPSNGAEPRYVFTFTTPVRIVCIGANTGAVTLGSGEVGIF